MNSTHDLGGMHGFGEIDRCQQDNFREKWEEIVFGLTLSCGFLGYWNLDESRFARESMDPGDYLASSYYEHWLHGLETLLLDKKLISAEELETGAPVKTYQGNAVDPEQVREILRRGGPADMETNTKPRFDIGDSILVKVFNPKTHTRAPRYIRGRPGVISAYHGAHIFPDQHSQNSKRLPAHLYSVRFEAADIWGADAEPGTAVYVDVFEPYLED